MSYSPERIEWENRTDARFLRLSMIGLDLAQVLVTKEKTTVDRVGDMENIPGTACNSAGECRIAPQQKRHFAFHASAESAAAAAESIALGANMVKHAVWKRKKQRNGRFTRRGTHGSYDRSSSSAMASTYLIKPEGGESQNWTKANPKSEVRSFKLHSFE
jgi:hypothetical protein